jgi:ankyrin repeat protein
MLHVATDIDDVDMARFLLTHGINMYAVNYEGDDALSIARDDSLVRLFSKAKQKRR